MTILLLLLTACQSANGTTAPDNSVWTGFLEGKTLDVSAKVGGRVTSIAVAEGDVVKPGQLLATIDDEFIRFRLDIADANIAAAQAQLDLLQAGARAEDLRKAEARVEQAQAALIAATQAVTDTEAIRANPQTLTILKTDAETRAFAANQQLQAAACQAEAADIEHALWEELVRQAWEGADIRLPGGRVLHFDTPTQKRVYAEQQWNAAGNRAWQAWGAVQVAAANADAANAALKDAADQVTNSIALDARVNQARAARERAVANLQSAESALQILREGASAAQIQTARAVLDQARAARATLDQELTHYQITAPQAGTVARVAYRVGEVAAPVTPIVRLTNDGEIKLRVFVSIAQLDRIRLGQSATIILNEANNRQLSGTVTNIAERAEFAGRQAQTDNDRNAQLIAVEITLNQPNDQVKTGMPASVTFGDALSGNVAAPTLVSRAESLTFSGTLEVKQTRVAAELEGRVVAVRVNRGDIVKAGDALIDLDDATIRATLNEVDAAVRAAQSNLDQVNEKTRPGALALALAGVTQAEADLQAANAALADANRALASPQDLLTQLHGWENKARAAQGEVTRAQATLASATSLLEQSRDQSMTGKAQTAMLQKQQQAAQAGLSAAQATAQGHERVVALYRALIANPLELIAAKNSAANQVKIADAGKKIAQAELAIAQRGAQKEAVALAEAKLRAAQANLKIAQAQAKRYIVASPVAGTVTGKSVAPGETVRAGAPLLTVADTSELEMTVYVPIRNITSVKVGQSVELTLPSLPGKIFSGKVAYVASEAEFKPANLYNTQERSEIVFAVRVTIPNASGELKAGLPGDVTFSDR
ncbi:MAG: HlyD family efflux transporter periplasmic adaptor subunit [Chloroflexota bacterium]